MADDDLRFTIQARGSVERRESPQAAWASAEELPSEIKQLLWAQQQAAKALPYQLRGARRPSLGTVYVRQDLSSGVEEGPADHVRTAPVLDEYGRLVEVPSIVSVRVSVRPPSKPLRAALDSEEHLVVVGGPGQGKSTLTLRLAADIALHWATPTGEPPLEEPVVPLRITARSLATHLGQSFSKALADSACVEYGPYLTEPVDAAWLASRIAGCRWLLLVDALDEVADPEQRAKLVGALAAWASSPTYRIVLTTRPTERGALAAFQHEEVARYELLPFDEEALEQFAHIWFADEDLSHRFLNQVREAHLYELVEVPLLATIAAIVFEKHSQRPLPSNEFELYESYLTFIGSSREVPESFERYRIALVEHLGRTRLAADTSLVGAVEEWARLQETSADELIEHLKAVGPFVQRGNDLAFLHHSFAEHVAATAEARDLPVPFAPERGAFAKLLHVATPAEEGRFARSVLLHYTYLHPAEADRLLAWLHRGDSDQHLLAARMLGRHLPASAPMIDEFLVTVRRWAMTTQYRGGSILRHTSRATHHHGLIEWLNDLMCDETAPWKSRAEAATALAVRVRGTHTAEALSFLRSTVDDLAAPVEHRLVAAEALAQVGVSQREAAERGLRSVLADPLASGADSRSAAVVLSAFSSASRAVAVERLLALMSDADRDTDDLVDVATGLVEIGAEFHQLCAEVFRAVLTDPVRSSAGRRDAAIALASLGGRDEAARALTKLVQKLDHDSLDRASAASDLAVLGPEYRAAAGKLLLAQLDAPIPNLGDRHQFAPVLAKIGHRERAVQLLLDVLADRALTWSDITSAAWSLAELGPSFREAAAGHLESVIAHLPPEKAEHTFALRMLSRLGEPHRSRAAAGMHRLLSDRNVEPRIRCQVANELVKRAPELIEEIKQRLLTMATRDPDPNANASAWVGLCFFGVETEERAGEELLALALRDAEAPEDVGVVFAHGTAADRAMVAKVLAGVAGDHERDLCGRHSAVVGLRSLGPTYIRVAAAYLCRFIAVNKITDFPSAVRPFLGCGRGIRQSLADELELALDRSSSDAARSWSIVEAMDLLGSPAPAEVLRRIVADEVAAETLRARAAMALARRGSRSWDDAADRVFLAAAATWSVDWRRFVVELAHAGVDVHQRLRALVMNPNTFRVAVSIAAWLLGAEGVAVLRSQAADPYMKFDQGAHLRQLLVRVDPGAFSEAIAYHLDAMSDPDLPVDIRCDAAKRLFQLDRTRFAASAEVLFELAEDPTLTAGERATAAVELAALFQPSCPPRLIRLLSGLADDPETSDTKRHEIAPHLPVPQRTALELVMLTDHSANIARRMPAPDDERGMALWGRAEQVVRDVLAAPEIGVAERRQAAVELAGISVRHVPEAVGLLMEEGSRHAKAEAVALGAWRRLHASERAIVLDETHPVRARRAAALFIGRHSRTPSVRDHLLADTTASWRDRLDELWFADADDELRAMRDNPASPVQRRRIAGRLDDFAIEDRAAAALTLAAIAADRSERPSLRWRAANDLAKYGLRGRAEAVELLHEIVYDDTLPVIPRSEAAFHLGRVEPPRRSEMLGVLRGLLSTPNPLYRRNVLESIGVWSTWEAIEELYRMVADKSLGPVARLSCAMEIVSIRRDQRDRCSVVVREIAFDTEVPRHVRRRAARYLAEWSDVCRQEARALLVRLRDCGAR